MSNNIVKLQDRNLYRYCNPFIVAEISSNHNQKFENAIELIDIAAEANVDAVKFQTFEPESLTLNSNKKYFQLSRTSNWKNYNQFSLYSKGATPKSWHKELYNHAKSRSITPFSTPFSVKDVEFLEEIDNPIYKIASYESNHFELISEVLKTNKPVFISIGGTDLNDFKLLINCLNKSSNKQIVIMNCVCSYPALPKESNMKKIISLFEDYNLLAGFSDHSLDSSAAIVAASLGAVVFEKHLMLQSDERESLDKDFSSNQKQFQQYVNDIRKVQEILGSSEFKLLESEKINTNSRRSIFSTTKIKKGEQFTKENVAVVRPIGGLHPKYISEIIGKEAKRNIDEHEPLKLEDVFQD